MQMHREATEEQWQRFIKEASAFSPPAIIDMMKAKETHYCEGTNRWAPPGGIRSTKSVVDHMLARGVVEVKAPRAFGELSLDEKLALYREDPKAYRTLKNTPETYAGKTYDELSVEELTALYREDSAKWERMRAFEPSDDDEGTAA